MVAGAVLLSKKDTKINKIQFSHTFFVCSLFLRCSEHWVGEQREFWEFRPLRHTVVKYIDKKGEQKMHVALKETWPSLSFAASTQQKMPDTLRIIKGVG